MKYFDRQKFQQGGKTQQPSEEDMANGLIELLVEGGLSEEEAPQIAQAFVQVAGGIGQAVEAVQNMASEGARPQDIVNNVVQLVQQAVSQAKQGMKLDYFKKLRQGGTPKKKRCPCMMKRVGGRLIEVDGCTGLPVIH